jgi:hypothetical protein
VKSAQTCNFAILFLLMSAAFATAQEEKCLILNEHCVELREYLSSQPASATIDSVADRLGDILVGNYFPDWPKSDEMKCVTIESLPELLSDEDFEKRTTEFAYPVEVTPPLIEYVGLDAKRFCHFYEGTS